MLLDIAIASSVVEEVTDSNDIAYGTVKYGPQYGPPVAVVGVLCCGVVVLYLLTDI